MPVSMSSDLGCYHRELPKTDLSRFFAWDFPIAGHMAQHLRQRANMDGVVGGNGHRTLGLYFATIAVFRGYFELT